MKQVKKIFPAPPRCALFLGFSAVMIGVALFFGRDTKISTEPPFFSDPMAENRENRGNSEEMTLSGKIVPLNPDHPDAVKMGTEFSTRFESDRPEGGEIPAAFFVVQGEMAGSHLYSLTQPQVPGGYRTKIDIRPIGSSQNVESPSPFVIGPFVTASEIVFEEFMGETLEKLEDRFTAVAPVYLTSAAVKDGITGEKLRDALAALRLEGTIDALCCDDKNCRPVKKTFSSVFDDKTDLAPILTAALETASILGERSKKADSAPPDETARASGNTAAGESGGATGDASFSAGPISVPAENPPNSSSLPTGDKAAVGGSVKTAETVSLARNLFYAFLGGMILNIMPCVLPVIGLKIVSFFEQAGQSRSRAFFLNLCYSGGILSVFTVLALMSVGLSYLFTYGLFQIVMGAVVFVMALNLMGVWEITLPAFLGGRGSNRLMQREGGVGAWFKGIITTLLAIPCGAPLLSPALVWTDAMMKDGAVIPVLAVYLVIGLGMAAPFLAVGAFPELLKFFPKPGAWMETFRNIMGFVLLTAVIWILFSMPLPLILPMVAFLFALWFACWFLGRHQFDGGRASRIRAWGISTAVVLTVILFSFNLPLDGIFGGNRYSSDGSNTGDSGDSPPPVVTKAFSLPTLESAFRAKLIKWGIRAERDGTFAQKNWVLFDQTRFDAALASGKTVMVDFTADWCLNCKVLESTVLHSGEILNRIDEMGIVTMTADWTNRDDSPESRDVGRLLRRFGGEQVPVVMIFTPGHPENPVILRGLFTQGTLIEALDSLPK